MPEQWETFHLMVAAFAVHALAVAVLALLFPGIRDAWDLATWFAYHRDGV